MRVVLRADASRLMGSGHLMRCLTLAESLREAGATAAFVTRPHPGNLNELLRSRGFEVCELAAPQPGVSQTEPAYAAWVGAPWRDDALGTRAALERLGAPPDWLIVDHYGLDERWEAELRSAARRILAIDDLADRRHDCDLLLDQNLVDGMAMRYQGKLPERCAAMLGPRYALLQPEYAQLHRRVAPRTGAVQRVCIYFGRGDLNGVTQLALRALLNLNLADLAIDVVTDGVDSNAELRACAAERANVQLHERLPSLAPLLAAADLTVGAAGATSWERLCLGVPSVVVTLSSNQRPVAEALQRLGLIEWLGHYDEVGLERLQEALARHIAAGADEAASRAAHALVDGAGAQRVRAALMTNAGSALVLRHAVAGDEALLLEWANDPLTRRNSFERGLIDPRAHHEWLRDKLSARGNCLFLVAETQDGEPLGTVRFDRAEAGWKINYSVAAPYRGRGLGVPVLESALTALAREHPGGASAVLARVAATNEASQRVFRRLGFDVVGQAAGAVEYRRAL